MFLDDGISRNSAPKQGVVSGKGLADPQASDSYTKVTFRQVRIKSGRESESERKGKEKPQTDCCPPKLQVTSKQLDLVKDTAKYSRQLFASAPHRGFQGDLSKIIGDEYKFVFWHVPHSDLGSVQITVTGSTQDPNKIEVNRDVHATIVTVPVNDVHTDEGVRILVALDSDI